MLEIDARLRAAYRITPILSGNYFPLNFLLHAKLSAKQPSQTMNVKKLIEINHSVKFQRVKQYDFDIYLKFNFLGTTLFLGDTHENNYLPET